MKNIHGKVWDFGKYFGDMATALIGLDYSRSKDLAIPGF